MKAKRKVLENPIFCALDTPDLRQAIEWGGLIKPNIGGIKLGLEFFSSNGPSGVTDLYNSLELPIFLDLKFHDIPNTVSKAIEQVLPLNPFMLNVHASGGLSMMKAAAETVYNFSERYNLDRTYVLGVTLLTSLDDKDLNDFGLSIRNEDYVVNLALLAQKAGLDGVVCSPFEVEKIRSKCGDEFIILTPGVRPLQSSKFDQKRILDPKAALSNGADYLVIGRPITGSKDIAEASKNILDEIFN